MDELTSVGVLVKRRSGEELEDIGSLYARQRDPKSHRGQLERKSDLISRNCGIMVRGSKDLLRSLGSCPLHWPSALNICNRQDHAPDLEVSLDKVVHCPVYARKELEHGSSSRGSGSWISKKSSPVLQRLSAFQHRNFQRASAFTGGRRAVSYH